MKIRILCLGNELVGDDGIGIRVGRVLSSLSLPRHISVELRANLGFELLDFLEARADDDRIIIVDAMNIGRAPGTCSTLLPSELASYAPTSACCHLVGISGVFTVAEQTFQAGRGRSWLDRCVAIIGIEGECFDEYTTTLSGPVRSALPTAVKDVLELVEADTDLFAAARAACDEWLRRDPTVAEACGVNAAQVEPVS